MHVWRKIKSLWHFQQVKLDALARPPEQVIRRSILRGIHSRISQHHSPGDGKVNAANPDKS